MNVKIDQNHVKISKPVVRELKLFLELFFRFVSFETCLLNFVMKINLKKKSYGAQNKNV